MKYAIYKEITDEEQYQQLKKIKDEDLMSADEWKKKRLVQLKKEGRNWRI